MKKMLELKVKNQLMKFCEENDVIIQNQSGFQKSHSCEALLQLLVNEWMKLMDENNINIAVFLNLKRAFEIVNRNLLLLKWFESYLANRKQKT